MEFIDIGQASAAFAAHKPMFEEAGVYFDPATQSYLTKPIAQNWLAQDAQPILTTNANSGVPAFLTTFIDPKVYQVLFAPTRGAEILGETRKGTWIDETAMFPIVEAAGEVSAYGDFNENGHSTANQNWPQRQSWLFQTISEYGEREIERAGLGRINWVGEVDRAGTTVLARFLNTSYFQGVFGLQNYGLLNDPNLSAALSPATKAYGGVKWVSGNQIVATANEIYADIQSLWLQLLAQTAGITQEGNEIDVMANLTLAMSPASMGALTATNSFGVNVKALLKENFPNLKVISAVQYATNGGNLVQMIIDEISGQETGYCSFNEKLRSHTIVRHMSSWKKKMTSGTWGAIIRQPMGISQLLGV